MPEENILYHTQSHIAFLTIHRPEKLNALTPAMLRSLESHLDRLDGDRDIRAVVLRASGAKAFCVGADIKAWSALSHQDMWRTWVRLGHRVFSRIAGLRQPVIAEIGGYAFGGGLELALAADLRIASGHASFAMPEVKLATVPGWAGTDRLTHVIGASRAKQMIFTGARIDAETARRWGLINETVAPEELAHRVVDLAEKIAANAPVSVQIAKQIINASGGDRIAETLEALAGGLAASTEDAREGTASFQEKREPRYKGD